jgi:hypothetical protein
VGRFQKRSRVFLKEKLRDVVRLRILFFPSSKALLQKDRRSSDLGRPHARSDDREKWATWPHSFGAQIVVRRFSTVKTFDVIGTQF